MSARGQQAARQQTVHTPPPGLASPLICPAARRRDEVATWALVKVCRIAHNWPLLASGAQLVDLPGVRDANAARGAVAEAYLKVRLRSSIAWVAAGAVLRGDQAAATFYSQWLMLRPSRHSARTVPDNSHCLVPVLQRCNAIWIAADITRAVDNKTAKVRERGCLDVLLVCVFRQSC